MKCEDCDGLGTLAYKSGNMQMTRVCFTCDGSGELCDVCGEASAEPGQNICDECADAEEDS